MRIEKRKIDELIPAIYNPRKDLTSEDPEYQKIKKSVESFGYVDPIIVNERNDVVVGGHQRLKVLKDLGYDEIEVSIVDLDDEQEKTLNIALNKISGEWDIDKLKDLLEELQEGDIDTLLTGFNEHEIEELLEELNLDDLFEEEEIQDDGDEDDSESESEEDRLFIAVDLLGRAHYRLKETEDYTETDLYQSIDYFLELNQ